MATQFSCDKDGIVNFQVDGTTLYNRTNSISVTGWSRQSGGPGNYYRTITESSGRVTHNSTPVGGEH